MDKDKLEMKGIMKSAEVAKYLLGLADGFKAGRIVVEQGQDSLTLLPAETAEVEIEAKVKKDKARFSLEVSWRLPSDEESGEALNIGAAPAAKPATEKLADKKDDKVICSVTGAKAEEAPKAQAEDKPAAAPQAKPEPKPESKPEPKTDAKPAPAAKPETKADAKPAAGK